MELNQVYINRVAGFLPNDPVPNDEMEQYMGLINERASRSKAIVLRNNGIKTRHYASDKTGKTTHTNAQMAALAIKELFKNDPENLKTVELLSCGTSTPDQMMPSHAVMVHGWVPELGTIEVVSAAGVCCSGMHSLKYAYQAIKSGEINTAIASGSERLSAVMRKHVFEVEAQRLAALENNPMIAFEKEFLRWMLSDGAGAALLSSKPNENGLSIRIDWLIGYSFANMAETCMYMGADKLEDGTIKSWMDYKSDELVNQSIMAIKQDLKLLDQNIVNLGTDYLKETYLRKGHKVEDLDYFLVHMSSEYFRSKIAKKFEDIGFNIPQEKWFTNLTSKGNIGAAAIYVMLEEMLQKGMLKKGNTILISVPESSRFSYVFGHLTVC